MPFHLDDLTDTQFEEFCFDVLKSLGFSNLSWRKGTGLQASPSDQGRDIQGLLVRSDIDGRVHNEKWFVECKHYKKGVPPDKIQGALSWASAQRPDVLLIVVSNFLSNPTKQYLEQFERENRPAFRIKVWELKDLENLTAGRNELRRKYGLSTDIAFLSIVNNFHLIYTMKPRMNTVNYLLELMDGLEPKQRDAAFAMTYFDIVNPQFRAPVTGNETLGDLMLTSDDYATFRATCLSSEQAHRPSFVHKTVSQALAWMFHVADKTSLSESLDKTKALIEYLEEELPESDDRRRQSGLRLIERLKTTMAEEPKRTDKAYETYTYICEHLVQKLLTEVPPDLSSSFPSYDGEG